MFRRPTLPEQLARLWTQKYRLPSNHELFQERTVFDLLVEFYIDSFEKKPIEAHRNEDGHIQFKETGDPLIDRWEEQIAKGEIPDLMEAFDDESIQHLAKLRAAAAARDPYQGLSMKDSFDRISREAEREGLGIGRNPIMSDEQKRKLAERLLNQPVFPGIPEYDE